MKRREPVKEADKGDQENLIREDVKRYSIFWVLIFLLVITVVVPLVSFALMAINTSKTYLEDTLRERQAKTAVAAASHIQSLMMEPEERLKTLITSFEIYSSDTDVSTKYEEIIEHRILDLFISDQILIAAFSDQAGTRIQSSRPEVGGVLLASVDPIIRQFGDEAQKANGPQYSRVYILPVRNEMGAEEEMPVRFLASPLHKDGVPIASLVVMVNLSIIQEALAPYGREFSMIITDRNGKLLFFSEGEEKPSRSHDYKDDPIFSWALQGEGIIISSNSSVPVEEEGKKKIYLVTCSPIADYGWLLFSYVDRGQFFMPITSLQKQSTGWVVISILGALLIGVLIARQITKPISNLTEVSRKLAHGQWGSRADITTRNEVGELGEAFNFMAIKIQKYIHEVEAKAEENKQLFMSSITAIANAIDAKDPYTRGHSARVSAYSIAVAKEYGFDEKGIRIVEIASLLHDVGKIGIEDKILRKPGALTTEEFAVMKTHPSKGAEILNSINQMKEMIPGIKHHHERWNGGGYPDNLVSSRIPILARIIGVADAFDAMTTDRPYQKAMTFVTAATRINDLTPTVYDPDVTEAFNNAFRTGQLDKQRIKVEQELSRPKAN